MRRVRELLIDHLVLVVATVLLVVALIVGKSAYHSGEQFGANISTELASIAITVIVIDQLYQVRSRRERKQQIIKQMGSDVNGAALEAVRLARDAVWLYDGSLKGANLENANLEHADLSYANLAGATLGYLLWGGANLEHADLSYANLAGATLVHANLAGANLENANLEHADLSYANLAGATLMGANLEHADLSYANLEHADLSYANLSMFTKVYGLRFSNTTKWPDSFDYRIWQSMINVDKQTDY